MRTQPYAPDRLTDAASLGYRPRCAIFEDFVWQQHATSLGHRLVIGIWTGDEVGKQVGEARVCGLHRDSQSHPFPRLGVIGKTSPMLCEYRSPWVAMLHVGGERLRVAGGKSRMEKRNIAVTPVCPGVIESVEKSGRSLREFLP